MSIVFPVEIRRRCSVAVMASTSRLLAAVCVAKVLSKSISPSRPLTNTVPGFFQTRDLVQH